MKDIVHMQVFPIVRQLTCPGDDRRFRKCDKTAPAFFLQEQSMTPCALCNLDLTWFYGAVLGKNVLGRSRRYGHIITMLFLSLH